MYTINSINLNNIISIFLHHGYRVIAPSREKDFTMFREISNPDDSDFSEINPKNSIKEFFFPMNEKLFSFKRNVNDIEYEKVAQSAENKKAVIIGARPCDCSALEGLTQLFNWDYKDRFFNEHLQHTTIITFACDKSDTTCFCTSVGGAPDNPSGTDIMFKKSNDSYIVDPISKKGEQVVSLFKQLLVDENLHAEIADVPKKFDLEKVKPNLDKNVETDLFKTFSNKCLGCGICTYLCPNCHCFDIVDEGTRTNGSRYRNYDSCQFALFTRHTSNHNPRSDKQSRWRQRLMHKFSYNSDRLGVIGCTGCGRCIRYCPVGMDISNQLKEISVLKW